MGRDQNTFAKRRREMEKKRKAELKLERRRQKKETPDGPAEAVETNAADDVVSEG